MVFTSVGCTSKKAKTDKEVVQLTETALYRAARKSLQSRNYRTASELLQELESLYPFGRYADQAQLEIIYAYYKSRDYEEARAAADRFIRLHPKHESASYAQYLKGLAAFTQGQKPFELSFARVLSDRDLSSVKVAFSDFRTLLDDYPDSEHVADARQRMIFIRNTLAAQEVTIGHYYFNRNAFIASANRGLYVVENYSQTPAVMDALVLTINSYALMGLSDLAQETIRVLKKNYPEHSNFAADGSYKVRQPRNTSSTSWLNIVSFGLLGRVRAPKPLTLIEKAP